MSTSAVQQWRWDQGRIAYLRFSSLKIIAEVLLSQSQVRLSQAPDPLRAPLESATGLKFPPADYRVWRNYARVFQVALLAARIQDKLQVTEVARWLAQADPGTITADDYLSVVIPRFRCPFPAFQGFPSSVPPVFPFCVLIRYLLGQVEHDPLPSVSASEVASTLIGNGCTGDEPLNFYARLSASSYTATADETRQIRELMLFLAQFGPLAYAEGSLYLDSNLLGSIGCAHVLRIATPDRVQLADNPDSAILQLGAMKEMVAPPQFPEPVDNPFEEYPEGSRSYRYHLVVERNRKLRKLFLDSLASPILCDVCGADTGARYPWTNHVIEVHHVLPLASPKDGNVLSTNLHDLAALCPTCHRAVHAFYARELRQKHRRDFESRADALRAYREAKTRTVLGIHEMPHRS